MAVRRVRVSAMNGHMNTIYDAALLRPEWRQKRSKRQTSNSLEYVELSDGIKPILVAVLSLRSHMRILIRDHKKNWTKTENDY